MWASLSPLSKHLSLHTNVLHSMTHRQIEQGGSAFDVQGWRACLNWAFSCQNCWFNITFADHEQFWHGCHTSTNGLFFALILSFLILVEWRGLRSKTFCVLIIQEFSTFGFITWTKSWSTSCNQLWTMENILKCRTKRWSTKTVTE